jgi:hypothetical protein
MNSAIARTEAEKVPCRICTQPTPMLGTKLCDRCYELETRVKRDPELAAQILASVRPAASKSYIDVVFDGPPAHQSGRFVEVEDEQGRSISVGEWIERGEGLWALRIPRS